MPSRNMKRHVVDFYHKDDERLQSILKKYKLKRATFIRECVLLVLSRPDILQEAVTLSRLKHYRTKS